MVGLALIGLEFFVAGHGVLAGGGTIALMLGGIFLVDPAKTDMKVSFSTLFSSGLIFGTIVVLIAFFVLAVRRRPIQTGYDAMIGLVGEVIVYDEASKEGKISVRGEIWNFIPDTDGESLVKGDKVMITDRSNMVFKVRKD